MQKWCAAPFLFLSQHQWIGMDLTPQENQPQKHWVPQESSTLLGYQELLSPQVLTRRCQADLHSSREGHPQLAMFQLLLGNAPSSMDCPVKLWQLQPKVRQTAGVIFSILWTVEPAQETKVLISLGDVGKCFPNVQIPCCKLPGANTLL